jgi:hypothetical protein
LPLAITSFSPIDETEIMADGVNKTVPAKTLMRFFILIGGIILLATTVASEMPPSPFAGKWHTRTSQVAHRPGITVNIMEREQSLSGTVVLVNPDASEIELPNCPSSTSRLTGM